MSFLVVLVVLFGIIALSVWFRAPREEGAAPEKAVKQSALFITGKDQSRLTLSAQVKKSGVTDIVALTPGVVRSVAVRTGQMVAAGQAVALLTNDYASGASEIQKAEARLRTDFSNDTFSLEKKIADLEKKTAKEDATKGDHATELVVKQEKLELERLRLAKKSSALDLALAERSDAALRPRALSAGTVEHIAVRPGELVSAGTVLMTIRNAGGTASLEAAIPKNTAFYLVDSGIAELAFDGEMSVLSQGYIGHGENALGLVTATYPLAPKLGERLPQNGYVALHLPLVSTTETGFLVPIDTIRSAADKTSIVVMHPDHSTTERTVLLGETVGTSVIVRSGLEAGESLVLSPIVLPGDKVEPIR
jgi:multidrug efflux pump subunit AcrA (membrane-fusion protein)